MRQRRTNYEAKGSPWHLAHYYHTLDHYHKGYIKKLSKPHKKVVMQVPAGLALINITNALCIKSLVGNIVIASENMIHFCYFMNIGCFGHYYGMSEGDCSVALTIAIRIILENESLDFDLDPRCILDKKTELKIMKMVKLQMQFIFGHEYAHILLNHLDKDSTNWINYHCIPTKKTIPIANYSHRLEYDADYNAIFNIASSEKDKKELLLAALNFFLFLDIYSQFSMLVSNKQAHANNTHPQPIERFNSLLNRFSKLLGSDKDEILSQLANTRNYGEYLRQVFKGISEQENKDILNFYGSMYLSSYKPNKTVDRIDF